MNTFRPRPLTSLYVAGPLSMGYVDFYTFLIPLYALSLGFDASEIGILVGARSLVAMVLSIHIGVLMDRFGTRKVTLFFVWTSTVLAPLFPLVPWFWGLLVLQLVNGAAVSLASWRGHPVLVAFHRFASCPFCNLRLHTLAAVRNLVTHRATAGAATLAAFRRGYYAAFVLDPDGNNIEAVYHGPAERSAPSVVIRA